MLKVNFFFNVVKGKTKKLVVKAFDSVKKFLILKKIVMSLVIVCSLHNISILQKIVMIENLSAGVIMSFN